VYKLLLCWRYLRTRYLAMVCIVSVMLGVATLIVVNSVMSGFSTKLRERLHGLLSDVVIEAYDLDGFADPEAKMRQIRSDPFLNEQIATMTPTMEVFAMLQFRYHESPITRLVHLIGVDPEGRTTLGGFAEHLVRHPGQVPTFKMDAEAEQHRLQVQNNQPFKGMHFHQPPPELPPLQPGQNPPKPEPAPPPSKVFVPEGVILGYAIAHYRKPGATVSSEDKDEATLEPGDDVVFITVAGPRLKPVTARCVVVDFFRSEMSEYDANYVFVPLEYLQKLRGCDDRVTSIQIRLKDYSQAKPVVDRLKSMFHGLPIAVETWEGKQGPLLAAIGIEKGILNVLLFLIIAVAGFGILAIFSMIVVEKTRDIGILKALGASNGGVLHIFLAYGMLLGLVGAVLGSILGLLLTSNLNDIEKWLTRVTGHDIFPRDVYYFNEIPTDIQPLAVGLVNLGAVAIAVVFSILPALRAAWLHPVRALRYE
jgi:lipoprotein-releasing system permease protein